MTPTPRAWLMAYGDTPSTDWCSVGPTEPQPDDDGTTIALFDQSAIDTLQAEIADLDSLRNSLADILSRTAIALRGPEPPLTRWGWDDLPDRVRAVMVVLADALRATLARTNAVAAERERWRVLVMALRDATAQAQASPGAFGLLTYDQERAWLALNAEIKT